MLDLSHQSMDVDCCMVCITEAGLYQTMMVFLADMGCVNMQDRYRAAATFWL